ncbi:MAG: 1-deoxy-D-xylulose-5-phosphate reductoisomerase [Clostridia bacterium]|nr:1-deoxy-D-xylulose-5-phosphate reductoisomerase [Clostridia bacterium]
MENNYENRAPLIVLGSTGSVGTQALDVAERTGTPVEAICAHRDVNAVEAQARKFQVKMCAMGDESAAAELRVRLADTSVRVYGGADGIPEMIAASDAPIALNAIIGEAGLASTLAVLRANKQLALANKESLVVAGEIVMREARTRGIHIRPVDSEHCAVAQCLQAGEHREVKRLLLTASGGPFFGRTRDELVGVRAEDALAHPTWSMGAKITIDSASMMNKGFEVIEAAYLFDIPAERVDVVVHRESIIHSMVEYIDGSVMAQMSVPDMRHCIQHALTHPHREAGCIAPLDLVKLGKLTFAAPDEETFVLLPLAREAMRRGGAVPAVLNAANEVAVDAFLHGRIGFTALFDTVVQTVEQLPDAAKAHSLEDILGYDRLARETAKRYL